MKDPLHVIRAASCAIGLLANFAFVHPAFAAQHNISMNDNDTFSPADLEVHVGDTVTWVNNDQYDLHDTTSAWWASGYLDYQQTYTVPFPNVGSFPYADSLWGYFGMTGTIVVKSTSSLPPKLLAPLSYPNGVFQITVTNLTLGTTNIIQASTNFVDWVNLSTNVALDTGFQFADLNAASYPRRFYRAVVLP
jgi:plastocyanin